MSFSLPALPYPAGALEPHIDAATMELHHGKHHQAYVDKVNAALAGSEWADRPVAELILRLDELPEDLRPVVRNNGGGHLNHSLLWPSMTPDGPTEPSGPLAEALEDELGGLESVRERLTELALAQFGSGWAWLYFDGTSLKLGSTPNQDSPLSAGSVPLLGVDVWEHAYYLRYQNRRPDYVAAWWNVIDWDEVGVRYDRTLGVADDPDWQVTALGYIG